MFRANPGYLGPPVSGTDETGDTEENQDYSIVPRDAISFLAGEGFNSAEDLAAGLVDRNNSLFPRPEQLLIPDNPQQYYRDPGSLTTPAMPTPIENYRPWARNAGMLPSQHALGAGNAPRTFNTTERWNTNVANSPGSGRSGSMADQASFANMVAQAWKDRTYNRFNQAIHSLALREDVDTEAAKRLIPEYKRAFSSVVESGLGKSARPKMMSLLQNFFDTVRFNQGGENGG